MFPLKIKKKIPNIFSQIPRMTAYSNTKKKIKWRPSQTLTWSIALKVSEIGKPLDEEVDWDAGISIPDQQQRCPEYDLQIFLDGFCKSHISHHKTKQTEKQILPIFISP